MKPFPLSLACMCACVVAASSCALHRTSTDSTAAPAEAPIRSLQLEAWDGVHPGTIDENTHRVVVRHLPDGALVRAVRCDLAPGATISPDPRTLAEAWPREKVFHVTRGGRTTDYTVVLIDYVDQGRAGDPLRPDSAKWVLAWSEEFNEPVLDGAIWAKTPRDRSHWNQHMSAAEELYEFKDGKLILHGVNNTSHPEDPSPFLTGGIWGANKQSFRLGRIDVCARMGKAKGFWPAIWMLPQEGGGAHGGGGEIDMMEHLNRDPFVYQTVHSRYTNLVSRESPKNHVKAPVADVGAYNVYSVEVYPDRLVYLVNNKETYTYPRLKPDVDGQFPFPLHNYYMVLSAQLGGDWVGKVDPAQLPVSISIDWVRYYRPK